MIERFLLLESVGQFESVTAGRALPLDQVAVVYAENGRGKTTLAAILRSLASGDAIPVQERRRLGATDPPHVVIACSGATTPAIFQSGAWNRSLPDVVIFDDVFVTENVYSGLVVQPGHRQNLHELILGAAGVTLSNRSEELRLRLQSESATVRARELALPPSLRGDLTAEAFCALPTRPDLDSAITQTERDLAAANEAEAVRRGDLFDAVTLPEIDRAELIGILARTPPTLDARATGEVEGHMAELGGNAREWLAEGMGYVEGAEVAHDPDQCPFCVQALTGSPILDHYRTYFSDLYSRHSERITEFRRALERRHDGEVMAGFERNVRYASERHELWARYCDVPPVDIDTADVARTWRDAVDEVKDALDTKAGAPLEIHTLSAEAEVAITAYEESWERVARRSEALQEANREIKLVKERAASADPRALSRDLMVLRATRGRQTPEAEALCAAYFEARNIRDATEAERIRAREDLDRHRERAFPGYELAINMYLGRFNAGFRLGQVIATNTSGGPGCTYQVVINDTNVPVTGTAETPGEPSFRNTLSAGDRNTLALAFFFASLDQDPNLADKIVVVDDPLSSLDEHRTLTTAQEIRALAARTHQLIVLSHSRAFACNVWEAAPRGTRSAMQVTRSGDGSSLASWDVRADGETEHDRRYQLFTEYMNAPTGAPRAVAEALRRHLESFLRIAYPGAFGVSTLLGPFREECQRKLGSPDEILPQSDIDELRNLTDYANRFHHDTNPAWQTAAVNDGELQGYVRRTLDFASR